MNRILIVPALLASALALSSCGSSTPKGFICPAASALIDTASMTVLSPGGTEPAYHVDLRRVVSNCDFDPDSNQVIARLAIDFTATRPAGGGEVQYSVPYFIGVSVDGTTIVDKKPYAVQIAFGAGQVTTLLSQRVESFVIVPAPEKKPTDYQMLVGLQLTKDQLDYNRRVGRYPQ